LVKLPLALALAVGAVSAGCGDVGGPAGKAGVQAAPSAPSQSSQAPSPSAPPNYIAAAHWEETDEGPTLVVTPTAAARAAVGSFAAGAAGWSQLEAVVPGLADHPRRTRLRDQHICHQQFATIEEPDKATWDLEADRPDVGYPATVQAKCNP
jgi:hypothetical protein